MTNMNSLHGGEPGAHVAQHDSNPGKHVELRQAVVLIRLPYLPSRQQSGSRMAEHAVPAPVVMEPETGIQPKMSSENMKKHGWFYKYVPEIGIQPKTPLGQGSSGTAEGSKRGLLQWSSFLVSLADGSNRQLASVWAVASDWKTAGFVVIMVLMLSALLLPRGGTSPSTELATHGLAEAQLPAVSKEVAMPLDPEKTENSAVVSSAPSPEADGVAPPTGEQDSQASKNEGPKLEPMTPSEEAETRQSDPVPKTPEEVPPLTRPEAEPETPSPPGPATAAVETGGPAAALAPSSDGATAQNDNVQPPEPPASSPEVPAEEAWSRQNYPVTAPSTYQYPSEYERLLSSALRGLHEESHMSSDQQSSIYGWQPSTVRLQPRIEPPPIR